MKNKTSLSTNKSKKEDIPEEFYKTLHEFCEEDNKRFITQAKNLINHGGYLQTI